MTRTLNNCWVCGHFHWRKSDYCSNGCYRSLWAMFHSDLDRSYKDRYRLANPDKVKACNRAWREKNWSHCLAVATALRNRNRAKFRAQDRARYRKAVGRPLKKGMGRPRLPPVVKKN
jgi:hypothetical protein